MTSDKAPHDPTLFDFPLQGESHVADEAARSEPLQSEPLQSQQDAPARTSQQASQQASPAEEADPQAASLDYAPLLAFREDGSEMEAESPPDAAEPDSEGLPLAAPAAPRPRSLLARRLQATAIDLGTIVGVCAALVPMTALLAIRLSAADWPGFALFALPFSFVWYVLPLGFWGQTPGMLAAGLNATDLAGSSPTFWQAACRWFAFLLSLATFGLLALLALRGPSLGDRLSKTRLAAIRD